MVGMPPGLNCFFADIQKASRNRTPSVTKQLALKCFTQRKVPFVGPFQPDLCSFIAFAHFAWAQSSLGNSCKLYPPLAVLHPVATQHLSIAQTVV